MANEITLSLYNLKKYVDDNMYVHPAAHPAAMITEDSMRRFVTDAEKSLWNSKAANTEATILVKGLLSATDKAKLDTVDMNAEENQNAFSSVLVGGTYIQAGSKTAVLELIPGANLEFKADAAHGKLTIGIFGDVASAVNSANLNGKPASFYATADHTHTSATLPANIIGDDNPGLWPATGISQYPVSLNQLPGQPTNYGIITHFANAGAKYQIWHEWNHPSGNPSGKMYHRNAGENDSVWGLWMRIAEFSEIPTALPANGGNSATVGNIPASRLMLKDGDTPSGIFNLSNATLRWTSGADKTEMAMKNYGESANWLTFTFGNDANQDLIKFTWDGTDGKYDVLDITNNELKSYKDISVSGRKVVVLGADGKIPEPLLPDRALQGDGGVPIGSIIPWSSTVIPNGWLECNGQFLNRLEFHELFGKIGETYNKGDGSTTFGVPDFRGEFLRGWDNGRGADAGRAFGSFQADEFRSHIHTMNETGDDLSGDGRYIDSGSTNNSKQPISNVLINPSGGIETRPRNYAIMFLIKAKNVVGTDPTIRDGNAATVGGLSATAFSLATHTWHIGEAFLNEEFGYKKFADGFIIQWGQVGTGAAASTGTTGQVTYPIAFPRKVFSVVATVDDRIQYNFVATNNITTTTFNWRSVNANSSLVGSDKIWWVAFGY